MVAPQYSSSSLGIMFLALFSLLLLSTTTTRAFVSPFSSSHAAATAAATSAHSSLPQLHMFTGIVEEMGVVETLEERNDVKLWDGTIGTGTQLTINCSTVLQGAYVGCSICVSGVCLTATELIDERAFVVGLAPETLRKSNLGSLRQGDKVNLERAAAIMSEVVVVGGRGGGRNSGHFVQGHVDDTGTIAQTWVDGDSLFVQIQVPTPSLLKYIVKKGFIAVDGTSLTVCEVFPETSEFTVMLVEYTQKKIILPEKQVGDEVNIEVDVLGKYAESALAGILPRMEALERKVKELETELNQYKQSKNS